MTTDPRRHVVTTTRRRIIGPGSFLLAAGGVFTVISGCVSPIDQLESAASVEWSIRNEWGVGVLETKLDAAAQTPPAEHTSVELPEITSESSPAECLRYAALKSAELEAAFYRWRAALERVPQATALPDPRFSYGYFIQAVETRGGDQRQRFALSQTLPWFGKLDLKGDVAAKAANAEFERLQSVMLDLVRRVKQAYFELYYLRRAIDLTRANLQILEQFEQIARARYRVAATAHPDLIRIQIELEKHEDQLRELEELRHPASVRFNALLNRPAEATSPWPESIPAHDVTLDNARLVSALKARNPQLKTLDHQIEQHRAATRLAHKEGFPDFTLSVDYILTEPAGLTAAAQSGQDPVTAGVSVNLPIWREKYDAGVREAIKLRLATATLRDSVEDRLVADLAHAIYAYGRGRDRVELYRDQLVPKARETLAALISGYQGATVIVLDLLDAEQELLEFQLTEERSRTDAAVALSTIEMLIGGDFAVLEQDEDNGGPSL